MRQAHHGVFARTRRALRVSRAPFAFGVTAALLAAAGTASAQVGSANIPLPNVLLLLDTSGSFEHMIDGSNPEDVANNVSGSGVYANCETAFGNGGTTFTPAVPNRWGVAIQALTGHVLDPTGTKPAYSCVTMDRASGPTPSVPQTGLPVASLPGLRANGQDLQYGLRDSGGNFYLPYDSGYYLPFHRPVAPMSTGGRCVYTPNVLPGATAPGGVGYTGGAPSVGDCPTEPGGICTAIDFPTDAITTAPYDVYPAWDGAAPGTLPTPNFGYSSNTGTCTFNQANDGIIDQAASLVRFGMMTFDNDPGAGTGATLGTPSGIQSPYFSGQWSYNSTWNTQCATGGAGQPALPWTSPSTGLIQNCAAPQIFELGARNPAAPPWEGRLLGFPDPNADVLATEQSNVLVQQSINSLRPYGATPTAAMMADAEYYFWGDPTGPGLASAKPDPFVSSGCRAQYIILLTDGAPNYDLRPSCEGTPTAPGGPATPPNTLCPYQLPEDTASVLAVGAKDMSTNLSPGNANEKVYTYVIGFAVSGNESSGGLNPGLANCAQLAAATGAGSLDNVCGTSAPYNASDTSTNPIVALQQQQTSSANHDVSPCCSLQRIAVAGGTQHAYFADTPGDLNAALAAVIGDITGQLGSRTLPVASPTITYAGASATVTASYLSTFSAATCPNPNPDGTCKTPWQSSGPWTGDVERQQYNCPGAGAPAAATPYSQLGGDDFGYDLGLQEAKSRHFFFFNGYNQTSASSTNSLTLRPYYNPIKTVGNGQGTLPTLDNLDTFGTAGQGGTEISNFGSSALDAIYNGFDAGIGGAGSALSISTTACQDPYSGGFLDTGSCAHLALSFAMAATTFPTTNTVPADALLAKAYQTGIDGPNNPPPPPPGKTDLGSNRNTAPLGAILDSTPAVVAVPSAQVRDDSYQAFATGLSSASLLANGSSQARDTMLYVATIDGLLHAFDTSAGIAPSTVPIDGIESWAFVPPAVLPHLISNYPGASTILLDGAPVVKDVIFNRCATPSTYCGNPTAATWEQAWHTMLVAGFGQGGRGYYALDVTDPRAPTGSRSGPNYTDPTYPQYVLGTPGVLNPTSTSPGPHFQWQITSTNLSGSSVPATYPAGYTPNEWFGQISATPAIATVYADPLSPTPNSGATLYPQEIGVAILPGGRDGLPVPGGACPRELTVNPTNYSTGSSLWATAGKTGKALPSNSPFNIADLNFEPRFNVRQWASACSGKGSAVAGRDVMVVSIATGQVLAVFARAPSAGFTTSSQAGSAWDVPTDGNGHPLIGDGSPMGTNPFLVATPLDSPMTGIPVVYPSGVGVVAQAVYIGDADGTMWRFDLSDPNPRNWTGAIFADAYSTAVDVGGGDGAAVTAGSQADWPALDSEAISVEPQVALDTNANVVLNFATGDQTAFNACYSAAGAKGANLNPNSGCTTPLQPTINSIYSVHEARGGGTPYHAVVNWYQEWTSGERVTGPMAIFNGILYFATYAPTFGGPVTCSSGGASLYAWDFSNVDSGCSGAKNDQNVAVGCGGIKTLDSNFPSGKLTYADLQVQNSAIMSNTIIPGVSIASTPSCTTTSNQGNDAYTGSSHTVASAPTPGTYSLAANIGKGGAGKTAKSNLVTQKLQTPLAPTIVDSWAAISE